MLEFKKRENIAENTFDKNIELYYEFRKEERVVWI